MNATTLGNELRNAVGVKHFHAKSSYRVRPSGLRSRRACIRIPLTRHHKQVRLSRVKPDPDDRGTVQWGPLEMLPKREPPHSPHLRKGNVLGLYREWCKLTNSGTQFVYEIALFWYHIVCFKKLCTPSIC